MLGAAEAALSGALAAAGTSGVIPAGEDLSLKPVGRFTVRGAGEPTVGIPDFGAGSFAVDLSAGLSPDLPKVEFPAMTHFK